MPLTFPDSCKIAVKRWAYACRAKRLLINLHNVFAIWAENGITQEEYSHGVAMSIEDNISQLTVIPAKFKRLYPYSAGFNAEKMKRFIKIEFMPRHNTIAHSICEYRSIYEDKKDVLKTWDVDIKVEDIPRDM